MSNSYIEKFLRASLRKKATNHNFKIESVFNEINKDRNEFLILVKPEVLYPQVSKNTEKFILTTILSKFAEDDISIIAASVFDGEFAFNNQIFKQHYSQLSNGAHGKNTDDIRLQAEMNIISSYDFLEKFPEISKVELEKESHEKGSRKLGNGLYIFDKEYEGVNYNIVNAFHPNQISHFEKKENMFIVFYCQSKTNYEYIANNIIGSFKPFDAEKNSLRRIFWDKKEELKMEISILKNGIHLSPSSLELVKNLPLYFDDISLSMTFLGSEFEKKYMSDDIIKKCFTNPYITMCDNFLFDIMEGKNIDEILLKFRKIYGE